MAATWVPITSAMRSIKSVQAATESVPTLGTEGLDLTGVAAVTLWAEADVGETFDGTGQVDVYVYDSIVGAWGIAPFTPFAVPAEANGQRRVVLGTIHILNPRGRLAPICNGVGVTDGGVTLYCAASISHYMGPVMA